MNYNELQDFIKAVAKSGATEVKIETEDLKLTVKSTPKGKHAQETIVQQVAVPTQMAAPVQTVVAPPVATPVPQVTTQKEEKEDTSKYIEIKAPMVGTFYSKPAPDKPAFVNVGDRIEEGQVICILEAMKLFNEIEVEPNMTGTIVKILIDDGTPVEFDQVLFLVDPS